MVRQLRSVFSLWTGGAVKPAAPAPYFCAFGVALQIYWGEIFAVVAVLAAVALLMQIEEEHAKAKWRFLTIIVGWGFLPSCLIWAVFDSPLHTIFAFMVNGMLVGRSVSASLILMRPKGRAQGVYIHRFNHEAMSLVKGPVVGRFKDEPIHEWVEVDGMAYWYERSVHARVFELLDGELVLPPGIVYRRK